MSENKPINVEAQRVGKVIQDTFEKLQVLALLNKEFFDEIRSKVTKDGGPDQIYNIFGQQLGKQIIKHADHEDDFNTICVPDGVKMIPDDENIEPAQIDCKINLRNSTLKLMRAFSNRENQLRLKSFHENKSSELESFKQTFDQLGKLYIQKLSTPLEEVNQINANLKIMRARVTKLKGFKEQKQDAFDKYCEECAKSKEQRDQHLKTLKEQMSIEKNNREVAIAEAQQTAFEKEKMIGERNEKEMEQLSAMRNKLVSQLNSFSKEADNEEAKLRKDFKTTSNNYLNSVQVYDADIGNQTLDNAKTQAEYEDTLQDLNQIKEEYDMRLEEKRKRDEIAAIMQKKNDEQNEKMEKLERACEFIQAHWRGLLEQRIMEKARKKKKGKRKKK